MRIKGADGHEYDVASSGVGGTGLGLGIAGTALGLLNGNGNGLLGGLFGGNRNYSNCGCSSADMPISRYEAEMIQQLSAKDGKIALLESNIYTDQKLADVYDRLLTKINANKEAQDALNMQQAVYNGTNTAALNCMQGQIAQLYSVTKLIVPNASICPGWGNVTVAPATTTTT